MSTASEDDRRLWNFRARKREDMIERMRGRDLPVADSDALWIGWVGNRSNVLLRDLARLERLIDDPMNAVRLAIAGVPDHAAGPILEIAGDARFEGRVVLVAGADAEKDLVEGVDVWIGLASDELAKLATSSGAIHLSTSGAQTFPDADARDEHDARELYELLEREIVPMFYEWNSEGIPLRWVDRVRTSMHNTQKSASPC